MPSIVENKKLTFHIYRFHLLPLSTEKSVYNEFFDKNLTSDELKEKKNDIFKELLLNINTKSNINKNPMQLYDKTNNDKCFLYKMANVKLTPFTKNFESKRVKDEPYVFIIINNDDQVQKIAISENRNAFEKPDTVKNIIKKLLQKELAKYGLNIEIEKLFDKKTFWKYASTHKDNIQYIDFRIIKPNLARISKLLPENIKDFMNNNNAHETNLKFKAPEKGVLQNIDPQNADINGLVDYSSKGGGDVKLKVMGVTKTYSTQEKPQTIEINEIIIEGSPDDVSKIFANIVK